jgi:hypothetical protein
MRKWANKELGLKLYAEGKDVYNKSFHIQDGSWAMFDGVRIYGHNSDNENTEICLSLNKVNARKVIKGLQRFIKGVAQNDK